MLKKDIKKKSPIKNKPRVLLNGRPITVTNFRNSTIR